MDELGKHNPEGAEEFVALEAEDLHPLELDPSRIWPDRRESLKRMEEESEKLAEQLLEVCPFFHINPESFSLENDAAMLNAYRGAYQWAEQQRQINDPGKVAFLRHDLKLPNPDLRDYEIFRHIEPGRGGVNREYPLFSAEFNHRLLNGATDERDHLVWDGHLRNKYSIRTDSYDDLKPFFTPEEYEGFMILCNLNHELGFIQDDAWKLLRSIEGKLLYPGLFKELQNLDAACRTRSRLILHAEIDRANRYAYLLMHAASDTSKFREYTQPNDYADSIILINSDFALTDKEAKEAKELNLPFSRVEKEIHESSQQD